MEIKNYRHKEKHDVICELINNAVLRFPKFIQIDAGKKKSDGTQYKKTIEDYTTKEVTDEFFNSFEEISREEYNHQWGLKLQNA